MCVVVKYHFLFTEESSPPTWNFQKYLVGKNGKVVKTWDAQTSVENIFEAVKNVIDGLAVPEKDTEKVSTSSTEKSGDKQEL